MVLADIAPNMSGSMPSTRPEQLIWRSWLSISLVSLETKGLRSNQNVSGADLQQPVESARQSFNKVRFANPGASWARSSELYLLASGFRMV